MKLSFDKLKQLALDAGIDSVGVIPSSPLEKAKKRVYSLKLHDEFISSSGGFHIKDVEDYYDPSHVLKNAKTVISIAVNYLTTENPSPADYKEPAGSIPRYTWRNYYRDSVKKLEKLEKSIKKELNRNFEYKIYSSGPFSAKATAEESGIGWYGRHSIITNEESGSFMVLGAIISDLEIENSLPLKNKCRECNECVKSCPTKALTPYALERKKCIQYLTNYRGMIPWETREVWGKNWYGCSICQEVCPYNKKAKTMNNKPDYGYVGPYMPLISFLKMSENEYREKYKNNQISADWINFDALQRNAVIALGNIKDDSAVPVLMDLMENGNELVKIHIPWTLSRILGKKTKKYLEKKLNTEKNSELKKEIGNTLDIL